MIAGCGRADRIESSEERCGVFAGWKCERILTFSWVQLFLSLKVCNNHNCGQR